MTCPKSRADAARLEALRALDLVGAAPDPQLAAACRTALRLFDVPVAFVSLIDADRQWLVARCGLDLESLPRGAATGADAIAGAHVLVVEDVLVAEDVLVVEDAARDPRFRGAPRVPDGGPQPRFYAGAPLALDPGLVVGALCVMDAAPRRFSADAVDALRDLAELVAGRLRSRRARVAAEASDAARRASETVVARQKLQLVRRTREIGRRRALLRHTVESMDQGLLMVDGTGVIRVWNQRALDLLGLPQAVMKGAPTFESIRRHQWENGEFADAPDRLATVFRKTGLHVDAPCYERTRPNGTVLEVRTVALPDGGAVRTYTDVTAHKQAAAALAASESRYRSLAEALPQKVYVTDSDGRITYANAHVAADFGPDVETFAARGRVHHPDDAVRLVELRARAVRDGVGLETEARLLCADGSFRWHRLQMSPLRRGEDGRVEEWLHTSLDIDDIVAAKRDLHEKAEVLRVTNDRLELALETSGVGLWDWDVTTGAVWASEGWHRMLGGEGEGEGETHARAQTLESWMALVHPDDRAAARARLSDHLSGETAHLEAEYRMRRGEHEWRWIHSRGRIVARDRDGRPTRMIGVHSDVTERKEAERRAAHMARHDPLTGLPNRTLLDEHLAQALVAFERTGRSVAVLCIDLDRFKSVNDMLGHAIGDALLSEVARRLRAAVRDEDTVARLGGDEFAIVLAGRPQPDDARAVAARIIDALAEPMRLQDHEVCVGTSIGIALADRDCHDPKALLLAADVALYRAKDEERNAYRLYEPAMDAVAADRRALELDLRGALARREFTLHLQPVVSLATGATAGYEALVRWRHPTRGLVPPADFIPICEQTGMIAALGDWVLREACAIAAGWPDPVRIAVNVSAVQLRRDDFTAGVVSALAHARLPAHRLELEFTETVLMQNGDRVLGALRRLRALGVRIALDDFGTGYSSLSYLSRFTFDKIKIDRSFVSNIDDGDTAAIVRAVVDLGARWGSTITAEGIETPAQLARVREEGCHEAQGYLLGRPRPVEDWIAAAGAADETKPAGPALARPERSAPSGPPPEAEAPLRSRRAARKA